MFHCTTVSSELCASTVYIPPSLLLFPPSFLSPPSFLLFPPSFLSPPSLLFSSSLPPLLLPYSSNQPANAHPPLTGKEPASPDEKPEISKPTTLLATPNSKDTKTDNPSSPPAASSHSGLKSKSRSRSRSPSSSPQEKRRSRSPRRSPSPRQWRRSRSRSPRRRRQVLILVENMQICSRTVQMFVQLCIKTILLDFCQ